ncbi:MAG: hypothetical protein WBG71_13940 [Leeuwenhoekiella sp.]
MAAWCGMPVLDWKASAKSWMIQAGERKKEMGMGRDRIQLLKT